MIDIGPAAACKLLIRPELLQIGAAPDACSNPIDATLVDLVYQGDSTLVQLALPSGHEIGVRLSSRSPQLRSLPMPGGPFAVWLHPKDVTIVT